MLGDLAVNSVTGLWHLEGQDVAVFADGFVAANPLNPSYDIVTVENGTITLGNHYAVIHVGLPIISDLETLNIDSVDGETISDKAMIVSKVSVAVEDSRGFWAGTAEPSGDDLLEGLTEFKLRNAEGMDDPTELKTEVIDVNIEASWNNNGRVFIRNVDPVPVSIRSIIPAGSFPFKK
jgi:hypothetical protein